MLVGQIFFIEQLIRNMQLLCDHQFFLRMFILDDQHKQTDVILYFNDFICGHMKFFFYKKKERFKKYDKFPI